MKTIRAKYVRASDDTVGIQLLSAIAQKFAAKNSHRERVDSHGNGYPRKNYPALEKQLGALSAPELAAFDHLYNHHLRVLQDEGYAEKANNLSYIETMMKTLAARYHLRNDWKAPRGITET